MKNYILEVQKFNSIGNIEHPEWFGKSKHIGYINKIFRTKQEAADYYKLYNPHMRAIDNLTWKSAWDPANCLMYIIREHFYEYMKIPPFEEQ
jgi:hypothetical protein